MSSSFALSRHAAEEHLNLAPPRQGHWLGPVGLALVAHGLLVAALTWGVGWKQDAPPAVFEAELWSRLPVEAAPRAEEPPAPPPPPPKPVVKAEPRPAPPPPGPSEAQIATEQARKKKAETEQREREKAEASKKAAAEKLAADKRAQADKKATDQKREKELAEAEAKRLAQLREDQMRRMMGQAGASGGPASAGTAKQASGPTAGYKQRLAALFKSNITFANQGSIPGNPKAVVEVSIGPTGYIIGTRLSKPSGHPPWDEAVMRALDKTRKIPADEDGRYPPSFPVEFGPND